MIETSFSHPILQYAYEVVLILFMITIVALAIVFIIQTIRDNW